MVEHWRSIPTQGLILFQDVHSVKWINACYLALTNKISVNAPHITSLCAFSIYERETSWLAGKWTTVKEAIFRDK